MAKMDFKLENAEKIQKNLDELAKLTVSNSQKALKAVGLDGETVVMMQAPVDTGRLKNSITHQMGNDYVIVGTNLEYAIWLEVTGRHKGWFKRAYNNIVPRAKEIFKRGLGVR